MAHRYIISYVSFRVINGRGLQLYENSASVDGDYFI